MAFEESLARCWLEGRCWTEPLQTRPESDEVAWPPVTVAVDRQQCPVRVPVPVQKEDLGLAARIF